MLVFIQWSGYCLLHHIGPGPSQPSHCDLCNLAFASFPAILDTLAFSVFRLAARLFLPITASTVMSLIFEHVMVEFISALLYEELYILDGGNIYEVL